MLLAGSPDRSRGRRTSRAPDARRRPDRGGAARNLRPSGRARLASCHRARGGSRSGRMTGAAAASAQLYSIGHSNHEAAAFLELLRRHGIAAVADVRSRPYSRFVPHFSKERLQRILAEEGIGYLFLGGELGGKPPRGEAPASAPDYESRDRQPEFRTGHRAPARGGRATARRHDVPRARSARLSSPAPDLPSRGAAGRARFSTSCRTASSSRRRPPSSACSRAPARPNYRCSAATTRWRAPMIAGGGKVVRRHHCHSTRTQSQIVCHGRALTASAGEAFRECSHGAASNRARDSQPAQPDQALGARRRRPRGRDRCCRHARSRRPKRPR